MEEPLNPVKPKQWASPQLFVIDRNQILSGHHHNAFKENTIVSINHNTAGGASSWFFYFYTPGQHISSLNGHGAPKQYFS